MFKMRLFSGILLVVIALITIISGGIILYFTLYIISFVGLWEFYKAVNVQTDETNFSLLTAIGYAFGILFLELESYTLEMCIVFLILLMGTYVFAFPKYKAEQIMAAFFGVFYVPVMLFYIYKTRMLMNGQYLVWLIFICSWGCDTCAYCVGMLIGKHKLAPKLSPKKSIEGAIGGVVGAGLMGGIYAAVVGKYLIVEGNQVVVYAVICAIGAVISQIGDLAASAIKRNHDIKDYGTLIPGHGGILDRFDSVIFTAPVVYILSTVLLERI